MVFILFQVEKTFFFYLLVCKHDTASIKFFWALFSVNEFSSLSYQGLQSYKDTELKQYWMPDSVSKECYDCGEKFTTFRRKHHCRVCGQIFCSKCCNQEIPGKIMGCTGKVLLNTGQIIRRLGKVPCNIVVLCTTFNLKFPA